MATITDPDGNVTAYLYDITGKQVAEINPLGNLSYTGYNADAQVSVTVDADGNEIQLLYCRRPALSRNVAECGRRADRRGDLQLQQCRRRHLGEQRLRHVHLHLQFREPGRFPDGPFSVTLDFTYDSNGNVTQMTDSDGAP